MIINQANLAGIYKAFSTVFNEAFAGAPSQWPLLAMQVPSEGRSIDYKWLGDFPMLREWVGDRVIKDLSAFKYEIVNKDYEATIEVDRNDIQDDQIGVYTPMIQGLAMAARQHPDILVFQLLAAGFATLCFDNQYFFDTDHPVGETQVSNFGGGTGTAWYLLDLSRPIKPIILQVRKRPEFVSMDRADDENVFMRKKYRYGVDDRKNVGYGLWQLAYASKNALSAANYAAARAAMMSLKNESGVPLGITPTHLVVPPTLESAGRILLKNMNDAAGATNPWFGTAELVVVPWLA
ncbi:MAG: Mu-like prophage major head subunit gpT family protein [Syntrophobacteraceae bacterium]